MVRRQYPLRPAYASTYNGSQGTTLERCAVDVRCSPFSHGHLYVALSRVQSRETLLVLTTLEKQTHDGYALTKNVVWKQLLLQEDAPVPRRPAKRPAAAMM